jgi:hypothetical protein
MFSILSIRERRRFWASRPSWIMVGALAFEASVATFVPLVGIPDFPPLPWHQTLFVFVYGTTFALFVNDFIKAAWMRRTTGWAR